MKLPVLALLLMGCVGTDSNDKSAIEWISMHKKPIVCKMYGTNDLGTKWTLVAADGQTYQTGFTFLTLPDTIKVSQ